MAIFGPSVVEALSSLNAAAIPVAGATTVYTQAISLKYGQYFAAAYKATVASGTPDITIQIEQGAQLPTTEGSADTSWTVPSTATDVVANLADENWHSKAVFPISMPFMRFKITGGATNPASATVQIKLSKQEEM